MSLAPSGANSSRAAFTLLELLAVIAIIALLAGIVIGAGRRASVSAHIAHCRAELTALAGALEEYRRIYGDYPQTGDNPRLLQSLLGRYTASGSPITGHSVLALSQFTTRSALDPITDRGAELTDAWDQDFRYAYKTQSPWSNPGYVLYSIGPDGADSPALLAGGFADFSAPANADNLYANRP